MNIIVLSKDMEREVSSEFILSSMPLLNTKSNVLLCCYISTSLYPQCDCPSGELQQADIEYVAASKDKEWASKLKIKNMAKKIKHNVKSKHKIETKALV